MDACQAPLPAGRVSGVNMAREILPICDLDLLRSELIQDPTRRGYGSLAAVWPHESLTAHRVALAHAIHVLLTARTIVLPHRDGPNSVRLRTVSRADQIGLRAVSIEFIARALDA